MNVGVLIYTYNRTDDARINMEIIRNVWEKTKYFGDAKIIHAFNGEKEWYLKKYLENELVTVKNSWHFQGASDLIDAGMKKFQKYKNIDYVIVLASDTWLIKPEYIKNILEKMKNDGFYLATCRWGLLKRNDIRDVGMAVDFFIIDMRWAKKYKMFPINYKDFYKKFGDLLLYQSGSNVMLEKLLLVKFMKAIRTQTNRQVGWRRVAFQKVLIIKDREPVHSHIDKKGNWIRQVYWPKMGLLTHHNPAPKRKILEDKKINEGKNIEKLLKNRDLSYYNNKTI